MNIIFFGSSQHSVIIADALYEKFGLQLVVTKQGPVVEYAIKNKIPFITANKLTEEVISEISKNTPDFIVVADYGLIIPKKLLSLPKHTAVNVHHSLLPKFRGTTPAPAAILAGGEITGVTIIKMTDRIDAGDILAQKEYELLPDETTDSLLKTLNTLGAEILIPVIENFNEAVKHTRKQDESQATYTPRLTKESGYINLNTLPSIPSAGGEAQSTEMGYWKLKLDRMIRAYYPWPGVWTRYNLYNKEKSPHDQQHIKNIKLLPDQKIQVEGKKQTGNKDFINGYPKAKELLEKLGLI